MAHVLPTVLTRLVGWAVGVYYRLERRGPALPDGPVLVVANHPNALVDPMVVFRVAGRPARPLAKAPLFEQALVGTVLKGLGGLPVYRRRDDPSLMHQNERTFDAAVEALQRGEAVQIFPEGQSHSEPSLTPLKTGAARIAFLTEERAGWGLGLHIVPVGLTYQRKHLFRGHAVATVGEALPVGAWRARYLAAPQEAVRELTADLASRLAAVTLNLRDAADLSLLDVAERLYARETGRAGWREREPLGRRLPRLQAFARGLAWIRVHDPESLGRLEGDVDSYRRLQELLGAEDADVPPRFRPLSVARFVAVEGLFLGILLPVAALATVAWGIPYRIPRAVVASVRPEPDAVSTYKLSAAMLAFPLALAAWCAVAWALLGLGWAVAVAVSLPLAGLAWIAWSERLRRVAQDIRVFVRAAPRRSLRDRLAVLREELTREFERIGDLLPDPGAGDVP